MAVRKSSWGRLVLELLKYSLIVAVFLTIGGCNRASESPKMIADPSTGPDYFTKQGGHDLTGGDGKEIPKEDPEGCKVEISDSARIVTDSLLISGYEPLLIKTGGVVRSSGFHNIYIENGGILKSASGGNTVYVKNGGTIVGLSGDNIIYYEPEVPIHTIRYSGEVQFIPCNNIQFGTTEPPAPQTGCSFEVPGDAKVISGSESIHSTGPILMLPGGVAKTWGNHDIYIQNGAELKSGFGCNTIYLKKDGKIGSLSGKNTVYYETGAPVDSIVHNGRLNLIECTNLAIIQSFQQDDRASVDVDDDNPNEDAQQAWQQGCTPDIPGSVRKINNEQSLSGFDPILIQVGGVVRSSGFHDIYIENGGILKSASGRNIIYVKNGGAVVGLSGDNVIYYEPGVNIQSIRYSGEIQFRPCGNIRFGSPEAPAPHDNAKDDDDENDDDDDDEEGDDNRDDDN